MISPLSAGLFHRGIANSGELLGPVRPGFAKSEAIRVALLLNCPIPYDTSAIIKCLREKSPEDMVKLGGVGNRLVVESFASDEPAFIDHRNYNNRFSNYAKIPLLQGITSEESIVLLAGKKIKLIVKK